MSAVIEGTATLVSSADPVVTDLVKRIPLVGMGPRQRPRRFRRYCECFEWVFNVYYGVDGLKGPRHGFIDMRDPEAKVRNVDLHAGALWHHLDSTTKVPTRGVTSLNQNGD
jgi:hypothetical protein